MSEPKAIAATFVDFKNVKTRRVLQIIFEVPQHEAKAALDMLGIPDAAAERWFGIAALKKPSADAAEPDPVDQPRPDRAKRDWRDLPASQQAALRCNEPVFLSFLKEEYPDEWHETGNTPDCVRMICNVESRALLDRPTNHAHRMIWHTLDSQYQAWLVKERVGA